MSTRLIEYCAPAHESLLRAWLTAPHIVEWWGPTSLSDVLDESHSGGCRVIAEDGVPVGLVRWHRLSREELDSAGLVDIRDGGVDMDLLIGSVVHLGRGIGQRAIREAEALVLASLRPRFLSLCTEVKNERAIRCYHRAGFAVVRSFFERGREYYFLCKYGEAAEPGATDNPDDTPRAREDH